MKRKASARWEGSLKEGHGRMNTTSGAFQNIPYSFQTRFENEPGTNPEELIAAAHAGCFSMALSAQLGNAGFTPDSVSTEATVSLERKEGGFEITKVHLDVTVKVAGISEDAFREAANNAKAGCPVSKLLKAEITMDARLDA